MSAFMCYNLSRPGGEVAEWSIALDLKSSEAMSLRGFESHPLRHYPHSSRASPCRPH